jgi:hypothetical protein
MLFSPVLVSVRVLGCPFLATHVSIPRFEALFVLANVSLSLPGTGPLLLAEPERSARGQVLLLDVSISFIIRLRVE